MELNKYTSFNLGNPKYQGLNRIFHIKFELKFIFKSGRHEINTKIASLKLQK